MTIVCVTMTIMDRKKRSKNFSGKDNFFLADVLSSEVKVIESKRHDTRRGEERKQAWRNVFNVYARFRKSVVAIALAGNGTDHFVNLAAGSGSCNSNHVPCDTMECYGGKKAQRYQQLERRRQGLISIATLFNFILNLL